MSGALVSIIIPTFNRSQLVANAIRSALAQSYPHKQLIVIDDGSTDDTRAVVSGFAGVEYYYQPNRGQAAARNAGLRYCRGEYIASLDSDDTWEPQFLSAGVQQLEAHNLDFVFLNWCASNGSNGIAHFFDLPDKRRRYWTQGLGDWWLLSAPQTRHIFIETCPAPSSAIVLRRTALQPGGWNEQMRIADDWCLMLDMVLNQPCRAAFTMTPHWLKNVHANNIYDGRDPLTVIQELGFHDEKMLADRFRHLLSPAERRVFRQRLAEHYFNYAYFSWKRTAPAPTILRHLALAVALAPLVIFRNSIGGMLGQLRKRLRPAASPQ